jgi:peptide/nickel transport system substrate-binding protein
MKSVSVLKRLVVGAALLGLVACGGGKDGGGKGGAESGYARSKTLYLAGSQWDPPSTFNPLGESWQAAWPVNDKFNLMYETILTYNSLDGKFEPLLGTLVSRDNDKVVVDLNPAAKWSDGQPVTSKDVKFIFELGKRFPGAPTAFTTHFISDIEVMPIEGGGERLSFIVNKEKRNNPLVILDHLQAVRIVPAHIFEPLLQEQSGGDPAAVLSAVQKFKFDNIDKAAVVSGPYNIEKYSNEKIVIKRRADYWGNEALYGGKLPAPEYIIHPIYKNNDHFAIALQKGDLDASQTFVPRIWLKKKDGVSTWYDDAPYFVPGAMPMLLINTTKAPLNDPQYRRAMAAAISYADIKELAVSGYAPDMLPGLIMNHGLEAKYFNEDDAKEFGVTYNPDVARKILADAGYKSVFKADGKTLDYMLDKDGTTRLPTLKITVPAGWSDWEAMVKIAEKGLRSAGMDVREGVVDASLYWPARPSGNFDLIMDKPAAAVTPSLPWNRFESVMSSRNWVPVGESMNENQGRYNNPNDKATYNPKVDELLKKIPMLENEEELKAAYRELNKIFMNDQPAIPLCYLPEQFYEFSDKVWKNWPTSANSYAPPLLPMVGASTKILWNLQPAK